MQNRGWILGAGLAVLAAAGLSVTGCGGAECADGTVEQDGECVLADDYQCGEDEVLKGDECIAEVVCGANAEVDGSECIADEPASCGDDTELEPNDNECIVTDEACGEGTAFSSDEDSCVSVADVCQDGTYFDDESGLCYPDAQCQPGDVVNDDGYCISAAENLASDAEYEADGNTNPEFDGTPVAIDIDEGDQAIFEGTIGEPSDLNDDDEIDQHVDYFSFEAEAGDRFHVELHTLGLPDPAFMISNEHDEDAELEFERFSADGDGETKDRQVLIPADGTYYLRIAPGALPKHLIGSDDWDYVGAIEQLDSPDPGDHSFSDGALEGTLGDYDDNFYLIDDDFEAGDTVALLSSQMPTSADMRIQSWASATDFDQEIDADEDDGVTYVEVPEDGDMYLVFDWYTRFGSQVLDYSVDAAPASDLDAGEQREMEVTVEDGDALRITWSEDGTTTLDADIEVTDSDGELILEDSIDQDEELLHFDLEAGDYTVTFINDWGFTDFDLFVGLVQVITPETVGPEHADFNDYLTAEQNNADGDEIYVVLRHDDSGDEVYADWLEDGESIGSHITEMTGDYSLEYLDFGDAINLDVDLEATEPQEAATYSADVDDLVTLEQSNDDDAELFLSVTADSTDDLVFGDYVEPSDTFQWRADSDDDFTVHYFDDVDNLDVTVDATAADSAETFNADVASSVTVDQSNDDDEDAYVFVNHDASGDTVAVDETLSADDDLQFDAPQSGDYTVYYYDTPAIDGFDVTVDKLEPMELDTFTVDSSSTAEVAEVTHDQTDELNIMIVNDDDNELVTVEEFDSTIEYAWSVVGLTPADYSVHFRDDDDLGLEADDISVTTDLVVPETVDFDETYSGTDISENTFGQHDFYLVELSEDATYDINLDQVSGTGWARIVMYETGNDMVHETDYTSGGVETLNWEFEADTVYVIRIGGTDTLDWLFDYELTFDEI